MKSSDWLVEVVVFLSTSYVVALKVDLYLEGMEVFLPACRLGGQNTTQIGNKSNMSSRQREPELELTYYRLPTIIEVVSGCQNPKSNVFDWKWIFFNENNNNGISWWWLLHRFKIVAMEKCIMEGLEKCTLQNWKQIIRWKYGSGSHNISAINISFISSWGWLWWLFLWQCSRYTWMRAFELVEECETSFVAYVAK